MRSVKLALGFSVILCLCCSAGLTPVEALAAPAKRSESAANSLRPETRTEAPVLQRRDARYRLYPSDQIAITFPLTPEFNQTITIEPDGYSSLTGAGDLRLAGLTTEEAVSAIKVAYSKILHDPIVTVELKDFNKPFFVVTGQVNHPGKYDLRGPISATEAIAMAGGMTGAAKSSQALLFRRADGSRYEVTRVNLKRILNGRQLEDTELLSGDMLYVPAVSHLQERDPKSLPAVYRESYRVVFFFAVPTFAALTVLAPLVSRIWIGRYDPLFVEFVAILAAAWLVNVLANPAYVLDLGTGKLSPVTIGCVITAALNAGVGFIAGYFLGGPAVVAVSAFSLAIGYVFILAAYHFQNQVPFAVLLPSESRALLLCSVACAAIFVPFLFSLRSHPSPFAATFALGVASIALLFAAAWRHPLRKRLVQWALSRTVVTAQAETP
jgi:polysaccharide export outer membrane protein